jgi:hypothetical protein
MSAINDANEGWLGSVARVAKCRAHNATLEFLNAKSQYKCHDTRDLIAGELGTPEAKTCLMTPY